MKRNSKVSTAVIRRLPRYYRHLSELQEAGVVRISSSALGKSMGLTASQIRQDLFCFGGFGQQGYGYKVDSLKEEIGEILGINQGHTIVVLGTGNLGRALIRNFKFSSNGFRLLAAFDVSPQVVNTKIAGVPVYHTDALESFLAEHPAACKANSTRRQLSVIAFWILFMPIPPSFPWPHPWTRQRSTG